MGIIDRIILTIYTLLMSLLSLGVIVLSLRLVSLEQVWTSINLIYGQWEAALLGMVFFLVSLRLLLAGIRSHRSRGTIVRHADMGDVEISLEAVEELVGKAARYVRGVRSVRVRVDTTASGLNVNMEVVVSPEISVPAVSEEIQSRVSGYIKNTVGVELAHIHILVNSISNDFKSRQRVE